MGNEQPQILSSRLSYGLPSNSSDSFYTNSGFPHLGIIAKFTFHLSELSSLVLHHATGVPSLLSCLLVDNLTSLRKFRASGDRARTYFAIRNMSRYLAADLCAQ